MKKHLNSIFTVAAFFFASCFYQTAAQCMEPISFPGKGSIQIGVPDSLHASVIVSDPSGTQINFPAITAGQPVCQVSFPKAGQVQVGFTTEKYAGNLISFPMLKGIVISTINGELNISFPKEAPVPVSLMINSMLDLKFNGQSQTEEIPGNNVMPYIISFPYGGTCTFSYDRKGEKEVLKITGDKASMQRSRDMPPPGTKRNQH